MSVYIDAIKTVWLVSITFAALASLLVIIEKEVPLRKELNIKYSIKEKVKSKKTNEKKSPAISK